MDASGVAGEKNEHLGFYCICLYSNPTTLRKY